MSDHPSTFRGENPHGSEPDWNGHATLHAADDGQGLLDDFKAVRSGTLAELLAFVMALPEDKRAHYAIEKSGNRRLSVADMLALASRPDYPGRRA